MLLIGSTGLLQERYQNATKIQPKETTMTNENIQYKDVFGAGGGGRN